MKSTDNFKRVISAELQRISLNDPLFEESLNKPNKNIDDCITYVFNTVKAIGANGFEDQEIFAIATHYYDEDDLTVGNEVKCKIVTNHTIVLTEEEIKEAKQKAVNILVAEERARMTKKSLPKKDEQKELSQSSLF